MKGNKAIGDCSNKILIDGPEKKRLEKIFLECASHLDEFGDDLVKLQIMNRLIKKTLNSRSKAEMLKYKDRNLAQDIEGVSTHALRPELKGKSKKRKRKREDVGEKLVKKNVKL